jgi:hypothetical protein
MEEEYTYSELQHETETLQRVSVLIEKEPKNYKQGYQCLTGSEAKETFDCETVACIGGWAWLVENPGDFAGAREFVDFHDAGGRYNALFWGRTNDVSVKEAQTAIAEFLKDPEADMEELWGEENDD